MSQVNKKHKAQALESDKHSKMSKTCKLKYCLSKDQNNKHKGTQLSRETG